jgi:hypothetical protein
MGSKTAMQPDQITWGDFTARQAALETGEEPEPRPAARNKRQEPALAALLMQAIRVAGARRGRLSQAERIRERTLLEILTEVMRSAR